MLMRILILLTFLIFAPLAFSQDDSTRAAPQCHRESLSLKEGDTDAAMGGVRLTDFTLTNTSSSACTLKGYPRLALLTLRGTVARRATPSAQLPTDSEKMPPQVVTLEAGKSASFQLSFNAGGAGYMGKPCPTYPKMSVTIPGVERPFVMKSDIQSCPGSDLLVSSVRSGTAQ